MTIETKPPQSATSFQKCADGIDQPKPEAASKIIEINTENTKPCKNACSGCKKFNFL